MVEQIKLPKLKGSSNYDIWAIRIEAILVEKGYYRYILNNPATENSTLDDNAYKAAALIKLALEDGPLLQTRYLDNPFLLWNSLKDLYEAKGFSSEFLLSKELINTTLNSYKGNLEEYINAFKRVINSLNSKGISLPTRFVVALLLNNLNKDYEYIVTIITQSIRLSSSVDLEAIIVQLLDESRRLNSIRSNKNYYPSNTSIDNSKKSSHYSNDVEMSMQTNSNKNTKNRINRPIIKCNYCNKKGHIESKCFEKYPNLKRDKVVNTSSNNLEDKEEQILASSTKSINTNIDFILDSSATIHTCYIKDLFIDLKPSNTSIK